MPCPFCGSTDIEIDTQSQLSDNREFRFWQAFVFCRNVTECLVNIKSDWSHRDKQEALNQAMVRWNTRATETKPVEVPDADIMAAIMPNVPDNGATRDIIADALYALKAAGFQIVRGK